MKNRIFVHDLGLRPQLLYFLDGQMRRSQSVSQRWFCRISLQAETGVIGNDLPVSYVNSGCVQGPVCLYRPRKVRPYVYEVMKMYSKVPRQIGQCYTALNSWSFLLYPREQTEFRLSFMMSSYDNISLESVVENLFFDHDKLMHIVAAQITRRLGDTFISNEFMQYSTENELSNMVTQMCN